MRVMHLSNNKMINVWEVVYYIVALFVNNYEKHCTDPQLMNRKRVISLNVNTVSALDDHLAWNKTEFVARKLIEITSLYP